MQLNLKTSIIGKKIFYLKKVNSTNEFAKKIEKEEGIVIIAEKQTKGKGRLNRKWESNFGGVYISIILNKEKNVQRITLMSAVAVEKTIRNYGVKTLIKWPNDILFNEKKLCGILCELVDDFVIVGIGVNLNNKISEGIREKATSLKEILGKKFDIKEFSQSLLENFEKEYLKFKDGKFNEILQYWKEKSILRRKVKVDEVEGIAYDVDEDGKLIVKNEKGEIKKIIAGDCILLN